MIRHPDVAGAILAGGRARRLSGSNKALVPLGSGENDTPLARILEVFRTRFTQQILVIASGESPMDEYEDPRLTIARDMFPGCGPLAGVHAALSAATRPFAFVSACDMPFLSGELVDALVNRARDERLVVPTRGGRPEPLHAIYPVSCLPTLENALSGGVRRIRDVFELLPVDFVPAEQFAELEGAPVSFDNINTPDDLARARVRIGTTR